jgi:hypothetical protein
MKGPRDTPVGLSLFIRSMMRCVSGPRHADLRQTGELVAGAILTALLTFSYVLWTGRLLGPAAYADFSAALSVLYFVSIALSPLMPATARLVTRYRVRGEMERVDALERAVLSKVIHPRCSRRFHYPACSVLRRPRHSCWRLLPR